jgi:hypothetical protein
MSRNSPLGPGAAHLIGLLFIASGLMPILAAYDVGPLSREDINGPAWLGIAAGTTFAGAGAAIIAGVTSPLAARIFGLLAMGGLALIGNWIAFGAGERICGGSISLPFAGGSGDLSGLGCRIPFGIGAVIVDAMLVLFVAHTLQQAFGGPPRLARLVRGAEWLLFASLAPILLPLLLFGLGGAAVDALKTRLKTGEWPRNEEFIARHKARREAKLKASRPPEQAD